MTWHILLFRDRPLKEPAIGVLLALVTLTWVNVREGEEHMIILIIREADRIVDAHLAVRLTNTAT